MNGKFTPEQALAAVAASEDGLYGVLLQRGSVEIGYYQPRTADRQSPHDQDEIYIVHTGHGAFMLDGKRHDFQPGDVFFVEAGTEHRFVDFSDDFAAWVVFGGDSHNGGN